MISTIISAFRRLFGQKPKQEYSETPEIRIVIEYTGETEVDPRIV